MSLKDDLIAAKALISTPEKWRKDDSVIDASCCAVVAIMRLPETPLSQRVNARYALCEALPDEWRLDDDGNEPNEASAGYLVGAYNDDPCTTHADIMALFDRAIAKAEAQS